MFEKNMKKHLYIVVIIALGLATMAAQPLKDDTEELEEVFKQINESKFKHAV